MFIYSAFKVLGFKQIATVAQKQPPSAHKLLMPLDLRQLISLSIFLSFSFFVICCRSSLAGQQSVITTASEASEKRQEK